MSAEIECRTCGSDLEQWNNERYLRIKYCPQCGTMLLKEQSEILHRKTTVEEISDMIRVRLLNMLSGRDGMDVSADELGSLAWASENCDGVMFYSDYRANKFAVRHSDWVDEALGYIEDCTGDAEHYSEMRLANLDCFLVAAFIYATEHYVFDQLGIERDEGDLTRERIEEIKDLIGATEYNGEWS